MLLSRVGRKSETDKFLGLNSSHIFFSVPFPLTINRKHKDGSVINNVALLVYGDFPCLSHGIPGGSTDDIKATFITISQNKTKHLRLLLIVLSLDVDDGS